MQKLLNKLIAVIVVAMLASVNFMPVVSYATSTAQDTKTSEENVEFNATINNDYNALLDVAEQGNLVLNIKVSGTGYLKNSTVTLENNNFEIIDNGELNVKSINGNVIELDEVNTGKMLNVSLPIKLGKEARVSEDILGRDSTVTLNAIYVNENGKERKIKKTLTEHLEWNAELKELAEQNLVRYIKFDENKTMISFKIKEGIEDNKMPVQSKEIIVNVPVLENKQPSNVIVIGTGITYSYENGKVTIKKENKPDSEGKIKWDSQDEYMITYIYDVQAEKTSIESNVSVKAQVKGNAVETTINNAFELNEKIGEFVEIEAFGTDEINKGYMYTNLKNEQNNYETGFEVRLRANVGFKDVLDTIKMQESDPMFNGKIASNSITDKKVRIDKDNLTEILGENGTIKVIAEDGTELGTLSKDNLELEVNQKLISIETSKVEKEGDLEVIISKVINSNRSFSREEIASFTELTTNAVVEGYKEGNVNSSKKIAKSAKLAEPTSTAQIDINVDNLSTVVKNEDVILTTTLDTKKISNALYTNAKLNITLPKEVKEINIKEANLIYEDELVLNNLKVNGNVISFTLDGTQTKYSSQATANGTVIRLVTDITLDNLAPTTEGTITLDYSNEATGEINQVQENIGIVAPTGFVTTNSLEVNGEKVTAQEGEEKISKIQANDTEKNVTISGTIVNNLGHEATGVTILGTLPTRGNKDANENDLGSNFDTKLNSAVNVNGLEANVLYSENANETVDGSSWTNAYNENSKAYKIIANGPVEQISSMTFDYSIKVPENLQYGNTAKSTYAVYYNNNAEQGQSQNVVLAKAVGLTTGEIPEIKLEPIVTEFTTGTQIQNNGQVKEGKIIKYRLNVKNDGKDVANNVKVNINLPTGIVPVNETRSMTDVPKYTNDYNTKTLSFTIDVLNIGETKTVEYTLAIVQIVTGAENEATEQKIMATVTADKLEENVTSQITVRVVKGDIETLATSNKTNKVISVGDTVKYSVEIRNANYEAKNNVTAKVSIPSQFKLVNVLNNENTEYSYDEASHTLTYKGGTLKSGATNGFVINLEVVNSKNDEQISITGSVTCEGIEGESKINTVSYKTAQNFVTASLSSNIPEGNMGDNDDLEYYIDVKNNSSEKIRVTVKDTIASALGVLSYEVQDANGTKQKDIGASDILVSLDIEASQTARLTIITSPYMLQKGRVEDIQNVATVTYGENTINTNTLTHKIVGTSENSAGSSTEPSGKPGSGNEDIDDVVTKEGTYKVSGTAWLDANIDGRKEQAEERISGLTVRLYDKQTGNVAKDVDGKELVTTTNSSGTYIFVNVNPGSYIVVVEIDGLNYGVTSYKVANISDSENSDFVTTKMNEKEVATTDTIVIDNANIYNIDLGLVKNRIFDLDINKTITRITVTNTKAETKVYNQNDLSVAKVELATANAEFATVLIEYKISIENKGQVSGYAKSIVDYIPEGMTFSSELNSSWYLGQDGNAYNTSLANTLINPGETVVVNLVLSRKMTGENTGTVRNTAEIAMSYNEYGLEDTDANSGNTQDVVDDKSSADVVIGMATGKEIASFTGITLGILAILGIAIYEIKKHIINKMYNFIERS